ncbi:hypothetical protein RN001_005568 [Aquatica leii]|uniref:DUF7869 domain-containing protein n=1 Tax=Aquatica leii TaxID=1421715 RepID=A0AAN7PCK0_9COLE|nr:hypothetical protein RN001_005568 [Aquatica leii]
MLTENANFWIDDNLVTTKEIETLRVDVESVLTENDILVADITNENNSEMTELIDESTNNMKLIDESTNNMKLIDESTNNMNIMPNENEITANKTNNSIVGEEGIKKSQKGSSREINRKLKLSGQAYLQRNKKSRNAKELKPNPCKDKCQNSCGLKYSEEQRLQLFTNFYNMKTEQEPKNFLGACIERVAVKRRHGNKENESRRQCSKVFYLLLLGKKIKVWQQFLLATLNISQKVVRYLDDNRTDMNTPKLEGRGKHEPKNKTPLELRNTMTDFIKMLPAVPSHYCRGSTTKVYLPAEFWDVANLYRIYKKHCSMNDIGAPVSEKLFRVLLRTKFNIGFHLPKKDKCEICETKDNSYEVSDALAKKLQIHLEEKEDCKQFSFLCTSFDLQKVLNTPHGSQGQKKVFCYLWGEVYGKRGSNEICTVLIEYLRNVDRRGNVNSISLMCDSCPGQNKNKQIISALAWFIRFHSNNITSICITFLLSGHTYMPADSVHATIERSLRRKIV